MDKNSIGRDWQTIEKGNSELEAKQALERLFSLRDTLKKSDESSSRQDFLESLLPDYFRLVVLLRFGSKNDLDIVMRDAISLLTFEENPSDSALYEISHIVTCYFKAYLRAYSCLPFHWPFQAISLRSYMRSVFKYEDNMYFFIRVIMLTPLLVLSSLCRWIVSRLV